MRRFRTALLPFTFASVLLAGLPAAGAAEVREPPSPATLERIRDAAMASDWAYQRLADLADTIGPRLSGSPAAEAAVAQVAAALAAAGLRVSLQPVQVPHWVRGEERGELVDYAGRPQGVSQRLVLTALGGSGATPAAGLTAPVLVLRSFAEIEAHAAEVRGRIVLLSVPYDQNLADNGLAGAAYGQGGEPRFRGPAVLAKLGAAAALVRSVGGANYRLAHTGATTWDEDGRVIPAAAVTVEDALLIERLAARGPVKMKLVLTPRTLPEVASHNVLADLPGREQPDQVVLVSGHLDSWDLGTGAMDDGIGVTAAMGAVALLKSLGLTPRRTIRVVAWMNEENGSRGGQAYFAANQGALANQVAAIESDFGIGRPLGLIAAVDAATGKALTPVLEALRPIGAGVLDRREGHTGSDIAPLQEAGVPSFAPLVDARHYFDYHHTPADTFDKVDPDAMRRQVAVLAALAWYLAELPEPLARALPPAAR
ncbi:MAG: M28 family metallopeptidase [Nevskia sp.]